MLSDDQRRRMETQKKSLQHEWDIKNNRLTRIRHTLAIETDESIKFKYEQQILIQEKELNSLTEKLDEIENKLQSAPFIHKDELKKQKQLSHDIEDINIIINERENKLSQLTSEKRQAEIEALVREMPSVTFNELEAVTNFILGMQPASHEVSFSLTDITQKISKNNLTQEVHFLITMGMGKVKDVGRFIEHNALLRPDFPDKLTAGFLTEYQKLLKKGITGDALFESLRQFSCGNSSDFRKAAAGLAVLSYLFEKCEVFER